MKSQTDRFQILSLDGGGVRGIFSAAVLAAIEEDLRTSIVGLFDLIAGTSTGGIIAVALGLGLSPREILDFYLTESAAIFDDRFRLRGLRQFLAAKFPATALADALRRRFGESRFGDSSKRLLIPAYNLGEDDVYVFRTAHHERLKRDYKIPAWKVAVSTSAAPTYFPCAREVDQMRLIDGGVWANNPSMVALVEAQGTLGIPLASVSMLSVGTSDAIANRSRSLDGGGFWQWRRCAVDVVLRGQNLAAVNQARLLLGPDRYMRINPPVPHGVLTMDGTTRADELVAKAAHHSRKEMSAIQQTFADHAAEAFTPLYT